MADEPSPVPAGSVWCVNEVVYATCFTGYDADDNDMGAMVRVTLSGGPNQPDGPDDGDSLMELVMAREVADVLRALLDHHHEGCLP